VRERIAQVGWVLDHLHDLASDFSVFHQVRDITTLDGPTFCHLAWRLPAYEGVMRARALAEAEAAQPAAPAQHAPQAARRPQEVNPGSRAALMADPAFKGIFSFG
jgi:hypothetical protein